MAVRTKGQRVYYLLTVLVFILLGTFLLEKITYTVCVCNGRFIFWQLLLQCKYWRGGFFRRL